MVHALFASRHERAGLESWGRHLLKGRRMEINSSSVCHGAVLLWPPKSPMSLQRPPETLVVRKIGHPSHREFAVGALAEADVVLLDERTLGPNPVVRGRLADIIREEKERLWQYQLKFHTGGRFDFRNKTVLLIDDGLRKSAPSHGSRRFLSAKKQGGNQNLLFAVPVASPSAIQRLADIADDVFALLADPSFEAVGAYYEKFSQTTDEEVLDLLRAEHANQ